VADAHAPVTVSTDTTGDQVFADSDVVAIRVDGELRDLSAPVAAGSVVEAITLTSADGLDILRHSAAHVLAQAVQQLRPEAKLGIGPPIQDGFYYDFDVDEPFTPEDVKVLQKSMQKIVNHGQKFVRRVVSDDEARAELAHEPYKLELIGLKSQASEGSDNESVEVGAGELTIYDNVDQKTGETVWSDLCRGPHLPTTKLISNGFDLTRVAAAYWRGSEANAQLQRIYGTAWPTKEELRAYQERLEEAKRRDHRDAWRRAGSVFLPRRGGLRASVFHPNGASSAGMRLFPHAAR
jgi:Threonyl-tRNA synthetase